MKTGAFIQQQYDREIARIVSEIELAKAQIVAEPEILALQAKLCLHEHYKEGAMIVHLNCSGAICLKYDSGNSSWLPLLTIRIEKSESYFNPQDLAGLSKLHLRDLKTIQPKRAGELVRMMAKRHMLDLPSPSPSPPKPFWKFW